MMVSLWYKVQVDVLKCQRVIIVNSLKTGKIPAAHFRASSLLWSLHCWVIKMLYDGKLMNSYFNPTLKVTNDPEILYTL